MVGMAHLVLTPVAPGVGGRTLDLDHWVEEIGDGGFGVALGCAAEPTYVLKRMDGEVPARDAIPAMQRITKHARVMADRLTGIIDDQRTGWFARTQCQRLLSTVTSHVGYSTHDQRIYLFQRRAQGRSLASVLHELYDEPPDLPWRIEIAKNFASAMYALRRCNVVHLDCRPVNVFVDSASPSPVVTLIDLDGCGVLRAWNPNDNWDDWEIPPMTMGRPQEMILPIWFPWDPAWQTPLAGQFKFAERWCVLSEVWKILSWGMPALGWLDQDEHEPLLGGAMRVRELYTAGAPTCLPGQHQRFAMRCQDRVGFELKEAFQAAMEHTTSLTWADYGLGQGSTMEERFFCELGCHTMLAFCDPRDPRLPALPITPRYEAARHEIPNAHWIQNTLMALQRAYHG